MKNKISVVGEVLVEKAVGELYVGFLKMRSAEAYQQEYDAMGTLISMLLQDRLALLKQHGEHINA